MTLNDFQQAATWFANAKRVLVITGAGVSADSGLPTYRGITGLYTNAKPEEGLTIEEILSADMLKTQPELTWKYISQIEKLCRNAKPNAAHQFLANQQDQRNIWIMTQNIDGLHTLAGSKQVIEMHGNIHRLRCPKCDYVVDVPDYHSRNASLVCKQHMAALRPDVVLFGEPLSLTSLNKLDQVYMNGADLVVFVGTTVSFEYILEPLDWALGQGIPVIEINPDTTFISSQCTLHLKTTAANAFSEINKYL